MSSSPRYQRIHRQLLEGIMNGTYAKGSALPTEKVLCEQYGVSRITAKHALDLLAQDGLIQRIKGKGSIVTYGEERIRPSAPGPGGKLIGVIVSGFNEAYGLKVVYGMEEACRQSGFFSVLRLSHEDIDAEQAAIDELLAIGVIGLVILPVNSEYYNPGILQLLLGDFPVVILDRQMRGLNTCFVGTDNNISTRLAMEHLISLGHKTIAWVSSPTVQMSTLEEREIAFQNALIENGLVVNRELWYQDIVARSSHNTSKIAGDINKLADHLSAHRDITAIFASEFIIARFVKQAATMIGYRVPTDLSVICYDSPDPWYGKGEFTYLRQQERLIGHKAISLLASRLQAAGKNAGREIVTFPSELVAGQSTGRARGLLTR